MVSPPGPPVLEYPLRNGCGIFLIRRIHPALSKVNAVPQLPSSKRVVGEQKIVAALGEHGHVVVRAWKYHDIVLLALSEEMAGSLIKQAR